MTLARIDKIRPDWTPMTTFSDLQLNPKVQKAIDEAGYLIPTPIQAGAIPPALEGRDVLGIAQTGTGKTASFTLPMITMLARGRARARMPRSLVLCPTRELAAQVAENFDIYAKHVKLTKALLIGGVSFKEQETLIDKGVDVLIATPGRLLDHFERGKLILNDVQIMVVDEADRMLDMGFIPDIERIFGLVPFTRQTLFFSATMAPEIERITNTFLSNPARIEVARQSTTSDTITQRLIEFRPTRRDVAAKQKRDMLRAAIAAEGIACKNAIIFCNRKVDVDIVAKSLKQHGLNAEPIHGDLDQSQRTRTLDGFRDGSIRFLIASDVAARGLDIPNVSHIINYDVPSHAEDYVHRIGRTGRAGKTGVAITLSVPSDEKYLAAIEDLIKQPIPRVDAPMEVGTPALREDDTAKPAEDRSSRSRRGGARSRSDTPRDAPREAQAQAQAHPQRAETPDPVPAPVPAPAPQQPPAEAPRAEAPAPRWERERSNTSRSSNDRSQGERSTGERGNGDRTARDRGRDRDRDRGPRIVGMGEHMPDFVALSFDERRGGPAREFVIDDEDEIIDFETGDAQTPRADAPKAEAPAASDKPKRRRVRKPRADATSVAPVEAAAAAVTDAVPATEPEAAPAVKPKPTRARKKPAAKATSPEASAEAASEEKPKPKRTRKKPATKVTAADGDIPSDA